MGLFAVALGGTSTFGAIRFLVLTPRTSDESRLDEPKPGDYYCSVGQKFAIFSRIVGVLTDTKCESPGRVLGQSFEIDCTNFETREIVRCAGMVFQEHMDGGAESLIDHEIFHGPPRS